ncbi:MAG: hypothetical protein KC503_42120, partial [Myxococcales bacterium]|nr:hypothetical protein [Myxococcales bacterium]
SHFAASGSGYLLSLPYDPAVVPAGGRVVALFADACGVHCAADPERLVVAVGEPLAVDSARGRVELSASGRQTSLVQLAVLDADAAATLQTDDAASQGEARRSFGLRQASATTTTLRITWVGSRTLPKDSAAIVKRVRDAVTTSLTVFKARGFPTATPKLHIYLRTLPDYVGLAADPGFNETGLILIDPKTAAEGKLNLEATVAHEVFHIVQFANANRATTQWSDNKWFMEGTAEWAADEVYDDTTSLLVPKPDRFTFALAFGYVKGDNTDRLYATQAFFKWLEARHPGTLAVVLKSVRAAAFVEHRFEGDVVLSELPTLYGYLGTIVTALGGKPPSYMEFSRAVHFTKAFDTGEKVLWDQNSLGPPNTLPALKPFPKQLVQGGEGDGKDRRAQKEDFIAPLATRVYQVTVPSGLVGAFNLLVRRPAAHGVGACVINLTTKQHSCGEADDAEVSVKVPVESGQDVALLLMNKHWTEGYYLGEAIHYEYWVGSDVLQVVQDEARLTSSATKTDDQLQCNDIYPGPCRHTVYAYPDTSFQQAKGRFIGSAQQDITRIALEDTPEGKAAQLYVDDKQAPAGGWTRASGEPAPKTWRVALVGMQPRQAVPPYPRYLIVETEGQSAPIKLPLVFIHGVQTVAERQYLFVDPLGIDANGIERVKVMQTTLTQRSASVFYGDGDSFGQDTGSGWPTNKETKVSFMPVGTVEGKTVGTFDDVTYVGPAPSSVLKTFAASGSGHLHDVFGKDKNDVDIFDASWSTITLSHGPGLSSYNQQLQAAGLPSMPQQIGEITIQRQLPSDEVKRLTAAGLDPAPSIKLYSR